MGGIFGGVGGAAMSRTKNLQRYIQDEIKNAKTQQDIDNLVNDINQNVQEGVLSKNDAEVLKSMVDENISKPSDLDIKNEKEAKLSEINGEISLLNKEDRLYNENLEKLNKRKEEVNSYYDNLAKESKKVDEVVSDDGTPVPAEETVTEVKVTEDGNGVGGYAKAVHVPGPLPFLGAGAAFGWSRRLRRRIASPLKRSSKT